MSGDAFHEVGRLVGKTEYIFYVCSNQLHMKNRIYRFIETYPYAQRSVSPSLYKIGETQVRFMAASTTVPEFLAGMSGQVVYDPDWDLGMRHSVRQQLKQEFDYVRARDRSFAT